VLTVFQVPTTMRKTVERLNRAKHLSWRLAHERMNAAIEAGFPLEAVAIAESLLTDRFLSFVNFHGAGFGPEKTLGGVAQKAASICRRTTGDALGEALAADAENWARERNEILHGIAKSRQGVGPTIPAEGFVDRAHDVAVRGRQLVRAVKAWHGKLVRNHGRRG